MKRRSFFAALVAVFTSTRLVKADPAAPAGGSVGVFRWDADGRRIFDDWLQSQTPPVPPNHSIYFNGSGQAIDDWIRSPAMPGNVPQTVPVVPMPPPQMTPAKRAMTWALTCMRHGAHWTFEGINWMRASIGFMRNHLVGVHGHNHAELAGLSRDQLANLHDAHHEGHAFANYSIPKTPPNGVDHLPMVRYENNSSCPGGHCPIKKRHRRA